MTGIATVSGVSNSSSVQNSGTSAATVDTNAFMKLLLAELRNQDPTKPMDSTQMVAQLSSFSQVEQTTAINARLARMMDVLSVGQAVGLVGRNVVAADGSQGIVEAVRITADGIVARRADGSESLLAAGSVIGR